MTEPLPERRPNDPVPWPSHAEHVARFIIVADCEDCRRIGQRYPHTDPETSYEQEQSRWGR